MGSFKLTAALLSQRDYVSVGPDGNSSKYLRDAGIPEMQVSAEMNIKGESEFLVGTGFGYKRLMPQIKTSKNYKTSETVPGISANLYLKHTSKNLTVKVEGIYLENGSEYLSISGYALKDTIDSVKGLVSYEPVRTISCWSDIHTNGKTFQAGLFAGYTQNLGTRDEISGPVYLTSNAMIKNLYRLSPRFLVKHNNLTFAAEFEYTSAVYGQPDNHADMVNTNRTDNLRILISTMYKF
jgi:hypothetical protein